MAFVVHPGHVEALALASDATCWLREAGHQVRLPEGFPDTGRPDTGRPDPGVPDTGGAGPEGADLVVSLGGDGTMLRAVALVHGSGTPVLGVNLGHLGYLTKVEPAGLRGALARFLAGDYVLDERMALDVSVDEGTSTREVSQMAFNDVVVEKRDSGHAVSLALSIGGRPFITYVADGLIVATPTGSTAYNLSSRGPIASPQLRAMIVTPVSPHMLFDRSLVLDPGEEVRVQVVEPRSAALIVDGAMMEELKPGTAVVCRSSPRPVRLVSVREHDFHTILRAKFGLPNRTEY
ncbi:MAG: NAD(+)/NADH kinase [Acidimicrobiales bacterium]